MPHFPFNAVLFDCDGVLVDSEGITNGVLRDMLEELGWSMTLEDCMRTFVGKAVKDEAALIEQKSRRRHHTRMASSGFPGAPQCSA